MKLNILIALWDRTKFHKFIDFLNHIEEFESWGDDVQ
jgi:hypothetical protein